MNPWERELSDDFTHRGWLTERQLETLNKIYEEKVT